MPSTHHAGSRPHLPLGLASSLPCPVPQTRGTNKAFSLVRLHSHFSRKDFVDLANKAINRLNKVLETVPDACSLLRIAILVYEIRRADKR